MCVLILLEHMLILLCCYLFNYLLLRPYVFGMVFGSVCIILKFRNQHVLIFMKLLDLFITDNILQN